MLQREPGNPLLINNYLYLKAVYHEVEDGDLEALSRLVEQHPTQEHFRYSYAFLLLRKGKADQVVKELAKIDSDPDKLSEAGQAIRAKALEALGLKEEARELSANIDWERLTGDEIKHLQLDSDS